MPSDTRPRMLKVTARLLQHRGYHGTSLNDILSESGAPRGSLYHHFPGGKDQLVLEATRRAIAEVTAELRRAMDSAPTPAAGVRSVVEGAARILEDTDYTFGCPVAGLLLDATPRTEALAELCLSAFEEWVGLWRTALEGAGLPESRAHRLALMVESTLEGALLIGRAYRDAAPVLAVAAELEAAVEAACRI